MIQLIRIITLSIFISSCSIYKMEIQQGNALSNETISQIQSGMSKAEVSSILGNPLLQDNFRSDRWDYVYYTRKGRKSSKKQNLTLLFKNDQLAHIKK
ncbi:MAG: outer membrane protein assembly factor BamE [Cocleimonas sp.]